MTAPNEPELKYCHCCKTEQIVRLRRVGILDVYRCSECLSWIRCPECFGTMTTQHDNVCRGR